ncbi:hypothetical protein WJD88_25110, partial [Salmonella enterica subsp. enterica serovar Corvallis]
TFQQALQVLMTGVRRWKHKSKSTAFRLNSGMLFLSGNGDKKPVPAMSYVCYVSYMGDGGCRKLWR